MRQAIALDGDFALAYAELGRRYYLEGERAVREQAEQLFAKALQLTDRLSLRERLWIQAVAEDSRGNRQQAAVAYKAYLAQYPDDPRAWFRLAWTQMATLGQFSEAAEGFKQVIRLQPNDVGAHINLASAYSGMEDVEAAIPAYQKAFTLEPAAIFGTFVNHEYGFTLIRAGRLAEAEAVFRSNEERRANFTPKRKATARSRCSRCIEGSMPLRAKSSAARSCSIRPTKRRSVSSAIACTW